MIGEFEDIALAGNEIIEEATHRFYGISVKR